MFRHRLVAVCALLTAVVAAPAVRADDSDPWFGRDKMLHFGASAVIAAGGYTAGAVAFDARYEALLLGSGLALAAGTGKELWDMSGHGDPSWRDFTWDLVGIVAGLGVTWGIDLALRGTGADHPPLGMRREALRPAFAISF